MCASRDQNISDLPAEELLHIREVLKAWSKDVDRLERDEKRDRGREVVRAEMTDLLRQFVESEIDLEGFRAEFDSRTRTDWDVFGLKGTSGAMFLNTLCKHIPSGENIEADLKSVLLVPAGTPTEDGRNQMQEFHASLEAIMDRNAISKQQVQPARIPFFVGAWWHIQDPDTWPIYYISARRSLEHESLFRPSGNSVEDYFRFRNVFRELAESLDLTTWEAEHVLDWYDQNGFEIPQIQTEIGEAPPGPTAGPSRKRSSSGPGDESTHTQIQMLLAKMGRRLKCQVWIAANDHKATWKGEALGDLSLSSLPYLGLDPETQRLIGLIDVIWLRGNHVMAAFEIEHTTSVYSGILRMSDLVASVPNLNFNLYIVTPETRISKVERELSRPTFRQLELTSQCGYFSFEELTEAAPSIMQWADGPSSLEKLAKRVPDEGLSG